MSNVYNILIGKPEPKRPIGRSRRKWGNNIKILWHVDLLLGGHREIGDGTAAIARQRPANNNRGMVFAARSSKQQWNSNRGTVFPVLSVRRCYEQDNWSRMFISVYSIFKSEHLSANIKITIHTALMRPVITYACPV
jgi:hypothetical protein